MMSCNKSKFDISTTPATREDSSSDLTGSFIVPLEILRNYDFKNFLATFWQKRKGYKSE